MKQPIYARVILCLFLVIGVVSCGGGSGGSNEDPEPSSLTGSIQKGGFLAGSSISFTKLADDGTSTAERVDGVIKDNFGNYDVSIPWNGWTKIVATGLFFDEVTGKDSTVEVTLTSIVKIGATSGKVNVNLFTHIAATRTEQLANEGKTLKQAKAQAVPELKEQLGLTTDNLEKLDLAKDDQDDNTSLLLFSAGLLAANNSDGLAVALLKFTDDFGNNGSVDAEAKKLLEEVADFAGQADILETLSENLKKKGYDNPPETLPKEKKPKWININPVANAGVDQTIIVGQAVTLSGSGTDSDGTVDAYQWAENGVIKGNNTNLTLANLSVGSHTLVLTVTDNKGAKASDSVQVRVDALDNKAPVANAGGNKTIQEGESITLVGTGSDVDGTVQSYVWSKDGVELGQTAGLQIPNDLPYGKHTYTLTVKDDKGASDSDTMVLKVKVKVNADVNDAPSANAGVDKTIVAGETVTLEGSGEDTDGTIESYLWKEGQQDLGNKSSLELSGLAVGVHTYTLIVTDNDGATGADNVTVTVDEKPADNEAPTANAGINQTITEGTNITLVGTGTDTDGTVESYQWKQGEQELASIASLSLTGLSVGQHTYTLIVTDDKGATGSDDVIITVKEKTDTNQAPTADAGDDRTITEGDKLTIVGSGSDADGSIRSYAWKEGEVAVAQTATLVVNNPSAGFHVYTLTVIDDDGASGSDNVTVTVTAKPVDNKAPKANAGADRTVVEGTGITMTGSGTDSDGSIQLYIWKEGQVELGRGANLVLNNLAVGVHVYTLMVTDDDGATASDSVTITVIKADSNRVPIANAGIDKTITVGTSITIVGVGSDTDGTIQSYEWKKNGVSVVQAASLVLNNLAVGVHVYTLIVKDDKGAIGTDSVKITVKSTVSENQNPVANAGVDKTIKVGQTVTLVGSGTDSDGQISSYVWKKGGVIVGQTAFLSQGNLTVGSHIYTLTVTDNDGATGSDSATVTVQAGSGGNQAPTANAGADKTIISGNNLTVTGSGSDSDGTIVSYAWKKGGATVSTTASLVLNGLAVGQHTYTLTVTDNDGATGSDSMTVTVNQSGGTGSIIVNLTDTLCQTQRDPNTQKDYHLKVVVTVTGGITGGGPAHISHYPQAGCQGGALPPPLPFGFPENATATYVITNIITIGASRFGTLILTVLGRTQSSSVIIDSSGIVTRR
jgi:hypothetical protein